MRSQKNSFIFLETIFSILLLSAIIAIFIQLPIHKQSAVPSIQTIENQFLQKKYTTDFATENQIIHFIKNDTQNFSISVKKISYSNENIKLHAYEF